MRIKHKYHLLIWTITILLAGVGLEAKAQLSQNPFLMNLRFYEQVHAENGFDKLEFPMSDVENVTVAGDKVYASYKFKEGSTSRHPNPQQILTAYYDRIRSMRGRPIFKGNSHATFQVKSNGKEYYCVIEAYDEGKSYAVSVILKEEMQEATRAKEMLALLNTKGQLDLYIIFSTGSADLSPASNSTINEIVELLRFAPKMSISIEGHTDNVGSPAKNKQLSEDRAISVKKALIAKGIDPRRMQTQGWGQEKPVADNSTEKGRLRNRRVSIVKTN
ncbi:OmpA family protein [Limibacter armeniacum]|uniref:OmpA family protein n=1 Tax=Limibacter armeniacum TaxID=466084 RepID=UPI002FE644DC